MPEHGIAVLIFDRRGSGASQGDFQTADFEDLAGDVIAAVDYLQSRPDIDKSKIGLHGTSQDAWIAPIAAEHKQGIPYDPAGLVEIQVSLMDCCDCNNWGIRLDSV